MDKFIFFVFQLHSPIWPTHHWNAKFTSSTESNSIGALATHRVRSLIRVFIFSDTVKLGRRLCLRNSTAVFQSNVKDLPMKRTWQRNAYLPFAICRYHFIAAETCYIIKVYIWILIPLGAEGTLWIDALNPWRQVVCVPKDEDGGKHIVHQNNRLQAPVVSTRSKTAK